MAKNSTLKKNNVNSPVFTKGNKLYRLAWRLYWFVFFRFTPIPLFSFRSFGLRLFGADLGLNVRVYPSANIWNPKNLYVGSGSSIGPFVNIYNQGSVVIGKKVIISQYSHICASTHDYNDPVHPLVLAPVSIEDNVWICADAFIGPHVKVSEGGVIGARAVLMKDAEPWSVYSGNPAQKIKERRKFE